MRLSSASVCLFLILAVGSAVTGAEIEWQGTIDSDFHNPVNWAGGVVPGVDDIAMINATAVWQPITLSESVYVGGLLVRVREGAGAWTSVVIHGGGSLHVNDLTVDSRDAHLHTQFESLYLEGGGIHALGGGSVWLGGDLDVTAAEEDLFDLADSTQIQLGRSLRVAGQVENVSWLPVQVEFTNSPGCIRYAHEQVSNTTTIRVLSRLEGGDADMDYDIDQLDFVRVLQAGKYLTGEPTTWGEGDWNGAPGGCAGNPPVGDRAFDQIDVIIALHGPYYLGPYAGRAPTSARPVPVPEPSTLLLAVLGFVVLLVFSCRRRVWTRALTLAIVFLAFPMSSAHAGLLPAGALNDQQTPIVWLPEPSTIALLSICCAIVCRRRFRGFASLACLAACAQSASAGQIPLTPASLIGGSGAWETQRWDIGPFAAGFVADHQSGDWDAGIDESDQNSGDANGGYWLGKEGDQEEFFVLDLGREYQISAVELFQTHNATFNDRSTNAYEIHGGTGVEPIDKPDEPQAGGMDLIDPILIASGNLQRRAIEDDPVKPQWVDLQWPSSCIRYIRFSTVGSPHNDQLAPQRGVGLNEIKVFSDSHLLQPGDADMDFDADQLDVVQVLQAGKYLTGEPATWGEGDWNGAPGGEPGNPPSGDGIFDQLDVISSVNGAYAHGPYAGPPCDAESRHTGIIPQAISRGGALGDDQTSIVYDPNTGEVAVDAPADEQLTSLNLDSTNSQFVWARTDFAVFGGSFDNVAANNLFKATFASSFGSISFGKVAPPSLTQDFVLSDLTVAGSLAGGGSLGPVDLVYLQELLPGDANRDFSFDQLDIVQVLQAGKYLSGEAATWGEGDWNGGPGGYPGEPPAGDGVFDQNDIVAALQGGVYLTGMYAGLAGESVVGADVAAVPEPASVVLLAFGLLLVVSLAGGEDAIRWRRSLRFPTCCLVVGLCASASRADIKNWQTGETIPGTEGITSISA